MFTVWLPTARAKNNIGLAGHVPAQARPWLRHCSEGEGGGHSEGEGAPTTAILVHVARPYVIEVACLRNSASNTAIQRVHNGKVWIPTSLGPSPNQPQRAIQEPIYALDGKSGNKTRQVKFAIGSCIPHFGKAEAAYRHY